VEKCSNCKYWSFIAAPNRGYDSENDDIRPCAKMDDFLDWDESKALPFGYECGVYTKHDFHCSMYESKLEN
jgi:hypothetical protein